MRVVSSSLASLLAAAFCLAAAPSLVLAQSEGLAVTNTSLVFNPADLVQEIIMGDKPTTGAVKTRLAPLGSDGNDGRPVPVEIRDPFLENLAVNRPFDNLVVTSPNAGHVAVVKVRNGKQFKFPNLSKPAQKLRIYQYGDFLVLRIRTITNELVSSIRAPPEKATSMDVTLTHTLSNTKVTSTSTTSDWASEATVTARAEASAGALGSSVSASLETSLTVSRSVSTTYSSSEATTEELSKEEGFKLEAGAGEEAALWTSRITLDVFVCAASTEWTLENPISDKCKFSHTVQEKGKRYGITIHKY